MGATLIFPLLILSFPQLPPSDLLDVDSVKVLLGLAVDTDVHGLSLPNGAEGDGGSSTSAESGRRWAGECRKRGRSGGRGITRPARSAAKEGRGNPPDRQAEPRSGGDGLARSEEHTSELQSLMRHSYAVFCLKKTNTRQNTQHTYHTHNHKTTQYT